MPKRHRPQSTKGASTATKLTRFAKCYSSVGYNDWWVNPPSAYCKRCVVEMQQLHGSALWAGHMHNFLDTGWIMHIFLDTAVADRVSLIENHTPSLALLGQPARHHLRLLGGATRMASSALPIAVAVEGRPTGTSVQPYSASWYF